MGAGGDVVLQARSDRRMVPKRAEELTDGGSLFWVIRGQIML